MTDLTDFLYFNRKNAHTRRFSQDTGPCTWRWYETISEWRFQGVGIPQKFACSNVTGKKQTWRWTVSVSWLHLCVLCFALKNKKRSEKTCGWSHGWEDGISMPYTFCGWWCFPGYNLWVSSLPLPPPTIVKHAGNIPGIPVVGRGQVDWQTLQLATSFFISMWWLSLVVR